jgi:hypothetical protein
MLSCRHFPDGPVRGRDGGKQDFCRVFSVKIFFPKGRPGGFDRFFRGFGAQGHSSHAVGCNRKKAASLVKDIPAIFLATPASLSLVSIADPAHGIPPGRKSPRLIGSETG